MKFVNKNSLSLVLFLVHMMSMVQFAAYTDVAPNSSLVQIDESMVTPATYLDHGPIWIDGNEDFISQAAGEGWLGDGSQGNPLIITGYHILTTSTQPFRVWNTDFYWEIRGNNATTETAYCGTWIRNTTHGVIADNIFHDLHSGMVIEEVVGLTIENNEIRDTTSNAIDVLAGLTNCTIRNNYIHDNAAAGIIIPDAVDVLIQNNVISKTGGHAIHLRAGENNTIQENVISQIAVHGIKVDRNCHENTIKNNVIQNVSDGINCLSDFNKFNQNTIRDCSGTGIKIVYLEMPVSMSTDNTFSDNTIINSTEYSVDIAEQCSDNVFTSNDFFESGNSVHVN
ncbi:MAG: right-handed parallel beta-helix repeat-containing protein, partial [Candidatus Thorarchaeota archaeon]